MRVYFRNLPHVEMGNVAIDIYFIYSAKIRVIFVEQTQFCIFFQN